MNSVISLRITTEVYHTPSLRSFQNTGNLLIYAIIFTENNTTLWYWADEEEYSTGRVTNTYQRRFDRVKLIYTELYGYIRSGDNFSGGLDLIFEASPIDLGGITH